MITIKDIARESGYSLGTVSRVLNNAEGVSETARKKILEVVDKYDFHLNENAKFLKQRAHSGIAVILKGAENMLFAAITELLQRNIEDAGFDCSLFYLAEDDDEVKFAHHIIRQRKPEGILFLGCNLEYFRSGFEGIRVPCVLVTNDGSSLGYRNISSVSTDDCGAAEFIIDTLIGRGHTRIGIIGGDTRFSTASRYRLEGAIRSFDRHGIRFDQDVQYEAGYYSLESGYDCAGRLFRKMPDVTAIFAMSDVTAIGAMRSAQDRGLKVPDDISFAGFDGIEITDYINPRLSTVRQNREEIAARSFDILLAMIRDGQGSTHELVPFTVRSGNSIRDLRQMVRP